MRVSGLILAVLLISGHAWGQETQVTAAIDSDSVGVQDQLQLSITVSGKDSGDAESPRLPSLRGFRVVAGPSVSTQFQWINGRTSSSKSFSYTLVPEKEGQFTIDPVEVRVGDKVYRTQPLQVRVTSAPRGAPPPRPRSLSPIDPFDPFEQEDARDRRPAPADVVIVRAELDRGSAYPGQQVTLAYRVYTQVSISRFQLQESPPLSGFWVEDLEIEKQPKPVRQVYNGREYLVFTVKKQALFPTTTGRLKIPSSVFAISAETQRSFFGMFDRTETLYRTTQEIMLDVKPLPAAGRPDNFKNAVGSFDLTAGLDKAQAAAGEAVALRIDLRGRGNLKMIPDISVPPLPDLTVYSSKHADEVRPSAEDQIGGKKTWEYVIVPKTPGRHTIPAFSFSFFDPRQEKYETVATLPISLDVTRGTDAGGIAGLSGSGKQEVVRRGTDINFIKLSAGDLEVKDAPRFQHWWMYAAAGVPLLWNIGLLIYQKQRAGNSEGAGLARAQTARRTALRRLRLAQKGGKPDARRFYDEAAAALSGYLSDRFNLAGIELTGDSLERALAARGSIGPPVVEETRACLQECDFGRFVSASASADKMGELLRRIRNNIDALEAGSRTSRSRLIS